MAIKLLISNAYLDLLNNVWIGSVSPVNTYIALGSGTGTLASALASGTTYTALSLNGGIPANLTAGQSLTLVNGISSQVVTLGSNATAGATSLTVTSFTATFNFPINTTSVVTTPASTDTTLQNEQTRASSNFVSVAGAAHGETITSVTYQPTQANGFVIAEVAWFTGTTASSSANTGTLLGRAVYSLGTGAKTTLQSIVLQFDNLFTAT